MTFKPHSLIAFVVVVILLHACVQEKPIEVKLTSPSSDSTIDIDKLDFAWQGPTNSVYLIEIATDHEFTDIIDSTVVRSLQFHTQLITPDSVLFDENGWVYTLDSPNYVMGRTYYWRVFYLNNSEGISISEVRNFTITDPRSNFTGTWTGTVHSHSWMAGNSSTDTTYTGSVAISGNADGSISVSTPYTGQLYPRNSHYFSYGNPTGYGSHNGAICLFDNNYHNLIYVRGSGGLGGGGVDTLFATR